jgi:type VI secretion system protein ImpF
MGDGKIEVRAPLFDRLVDRDLRLRRELRPMRTLDRRGLRESVRRELEQLFNTRCPVPAHRLAGRERTVIDYGIPDFSTFSPRSHDDCKRLERVLREAIEVYEPRLANVRVYIEPVKDGEPFALSAEVRADIIIDRVAEPVSFLTLMHLKDGGVAVQ